ncbi:MAG: APC family permease [Micropruina sp.]|nr:APC family permease [Micropruina sp.]
MAESKPTGKLRLWQAIAISVGFMAPVLAMSLNGIGVAAMVGPSVPLVFVIAFAGVGAVAYGFVRLTSYFNHAGSIYGLVGITVGPRAGFFGGWALLGTYVFFAACTLASCGVFFEAFLQQLGITGAPHWLIVSLLCAAVVLALNIRESAMAANVLLAIGGVGIAAMLILAAIILGRAGSGTAPGGQRIDLVSTFVPADGVSFGTLMAASVFAFLSWAGFESCSSLGEETENPRRNIPRAIAGAVVLGGLLYVLMMFAQTIGFGTDAAGMEAFAGSNSSISDLAAAYVGEWFAVILAFCALMVALASTIGSTAAAGRLLYALARDGFGPKQLGVLSKHGVPGNAVICVVVLAFALCAGLGVAGVGAFDAYYWYATIAVLCMLVAYSVASAGVIYFTLKGNNTIPTWEIVIPVLGICYLLYVYSQQLGTEYPYTLFPWIAGAWCLIGLAVVLLAPSIAQRVGARLTEELGESDTAGTTAGKEQ